MRFPGICTLWMCEPLLRTNAIFIPCMYLTTLTLRPWREMVVSTSPALLLHGRLWGGHHEVMALNRSCRSSFWASSSAGDTKVQSFTRICVSGAHRNQKLAHLTATLCKGNQSEFITHAFGNCHYRYDKNNITVSAMFSPGRRLSGGAPCDRPGAAPAGCDPGPGFCPVWVVEEEVGAAAVAVWGLPGPQPCAAGQRTGRGIWPGWRVRT